MIFRLSQKKRPEPDRTPARLACALLLYARAEYLVGQLPREGELCGDGLAALLEGLHRVGCALFKSKAHELVDQDAMLDKSAVGHGAISPGGASRNARMSSSTRSRMTG